MLSASVVISERKALHALVHIVGESGVHELAGCADNGDKAVYLSEVDPPEFLSISGLGAAGKERRRNHTHNNATPAVSIIECHDFRSTAL